MIERGIYMNIESRRYSTNIMVREDAKSQDIVAIKALCADRSLTEEDIRLIISTLRVKYKS